MQTVAVFTQRAGTLIKGAIALVLCAAVAYLALAYTELPVAVPFLRFPSLQSCQRLTGLVYLSVPPDNSRRGEVWRVGSDNTPRQVLVQPSLDKTGVLASPDGKHIVYKIREGDPPQERLFIACADGTRSFPLTDWFQEFGWQWLGPDILYYDAGSYLKQSDLKNNDHRAYLLNITTGETKVVEKPYQHEEEAQNPKNPDLVSVFDPGDDYWLVNTRTRSRTKIMNMSQGGYGGYVSGQWSPDGQRLAFSARPVKKDAELYLVNADGAGLVQITNMSSGFPGFTFGEIVWSPNQKWLAVTLFDEESPNVRHLCLLSLDSKELIDMNVSWDNPEWPVWSADSNQIAFKATSTNEGQEDIFAISVSTRKTRQLTNNADWKGFLCWQ